MTDDTPSPVAETAVDTSRETVERLAAELFGTEVLSVRGDTAVTQGAATLRALLAERAALVEVAKRARKFIADTRDGNAETAESFRKMANALDALPSGILDHSEG